MRLRPCADTIATVPQVVLPSSAAPFSGLYPPYPPPISSYPGLLVPLSLPHRVSSPRLFVSLSPPISSYPGLLVPLSPSHRASLPQFFASLSPPISSYPGLLVPLFPPHRASSPRCSPPYPLLYPPILAYWCLCFLLIVLLRLCFLPPYLLLYLPILAYWCLYPRLIVLLRLILRLLFFLSTEEIKDDLGLRRADNGSNFLDSCTLNVSH